MRVPLRSVVVTGVVAALIACVSVLALPSAAHAYAPVTSFAWSSGGAADWIGQGSSGTLAPPATFQLAGTGGGVTTVTVTSGSDVWTVKLAAPIGGQLLPGQYTDVQRTASRTGTHAGLDISGQFSGQGRSCSTVSGSFIV